MSRHRAVLSTVLFAGVGLINAFPVVGVLGSAPLTSLYGQTIAHGTPWVRHSISESAAHCLVERGLPGQASMFVTADVWYGREALKLSGVAIRDDERRQP